jgi:glucuronate isomerase
MGFITETFLLQTEAARRLYHGYAANQPILDYHCHLPPKDIAADRHFENLFEIWLEGDHYKWRAMRANGIAERYCTGDVSAYEKFAAWAGTVPHTLRNPLYHWTHLELLRYFGIDTLLDEHSAAQIWGETGDLLRDGDFSTRKILRKFGVAALCTTDDPADSLQYHVQLQSAEGLTVLPAFRPDGALKTQDPAAFHRWIDRLGESANIQISRFPHLLDALRKRHDDFHRVGCRLSDHGLDVCYAEPCSDGEAAAIFEKVRSGTVPSATESAGFAGHLMLFFGRLDAEKGWTKQLHLGARRDANTRALRELGSNSGFDSIGDWRQADPLVRYLDRLDQEHALPKMIVYNINPADDYIFASIVGNFQDGSIPGKVQFGSGWWFLDQKEGIEWQLNALSNCGLLSRFVGMTTDSRSFMSFPRHEYFRRVLCNLLGSEMESGLLPNDEKLIGGMIRNICFDNAVRYFAFPSVQSVVESPVPAFTR